MLQFKNITPADRDIITAYTLPSARRGCELSFSNLCSWGALYGTEYATWQGWLLLRHRPEGRLMYMLPLKGETAISGKNGPDRATLIQAVETIIDDARRQGQPFRMTGIPRGTVDLLGQLMPGRLTFSTDRAFADYIYLRQDLATLAGKRLQPKRNHVNQFLRQYPGYEYLPITPDLLEDCLQMEEWWYRANPELIYLGTAAERQAVDYALRHWRELHLEGGMLRVDGQTVAFTFGSPICHDTFDIHAEKADRRFLGAYAMINHEFARRLPPQFTYINREEDLGIPGLRQAKLSYHPAMLLEKYVAVLT